MGRRTVNEAAGDGSASSTTKLTVLVFHHALGLAPGVRSVADQLRAAGHAVVCPDLYDGRLFNSIDDGVAYAEQLGTDTFVERGLQAAANVDGPMVVVGFSLGVLPAQKLAQTDNRVVGAVLCFSAVPADYFADRWPPDVDVQVHLVDGDPWAEEDRPAAEALVEQAGGRLVIHGGKGHLILEPALSDHDPAATSAMVSDRLEFVVAAASPPGP